MNAARRLSQSISEGDSISLVALVGTAADAARVEASGADAVVVSPATAAVVASVGEATSLPLVADWRADRPAQVSGIDACILNVGADAGWLDRVEEIGGALEVVFRIEDEEELEAALEAFDPEIFVLTAAAVDGEEALEQVLDLLADVPAGKLAIAEVPGASRDDVAALERAGFDGVIVAPQQVAELAGEGPPEV